MDKKMKNENKWNEIYKNTISFEKEPMPRSFIQ